MLDVVRIDLPVQILALVGLAFLLFLAGLEIDARQLRERVLGLAVIGYDVTLLLGTAWGRVSPRPTWSRNRCCWRAPFR